MRFLVIFIFLISHAIANDSPEIKNLVINKKLKTYENITFLDANEKIISLSEFRGNLVLLNFWATWCAPCKEEMPSLDGLKLSPELSNIEIFPINIGKDSFKKSDRFFKDLNIINESLGLKKLSMGMSSDYILAIENSATHVRIGSNIFGERH